MNALAPRRRAFTLVEAIAALVVLSIAAPTALLMLTDASGSRANVVNAIRAANFAEALLETCVADASDKNVAETMRDEATYVAQLRNRVQTRFAAMYEATGLDWQIDLVSAAVVRTPEGAEATLAPAAADPDFRVITVHVEWVDAGGHGRTLSLQALVARP